MTGNWSGGIVESMNGEEPPSVSEWQSVSVPGSPSTFAGETAPIAYRRRFSDPRQSDSERAILELTGVYGHAHIWVNDRYRGDHVGPAEPARVTFDPAPENELLVVCEPNGTTAALSAFESSPAAAAVPGIRESVTVSRRPPTFLREMRVRPTVSDGRARLDVTVEVDTAESLDDVLTFTLRPNGFRGGGSMERTSVQASPDERVRVEKSIDVRDPSLWWPRELGAQHRYTLRVKLGDRSLERTVGLRAVERDETGFLVNGRRVPARGFTVRPGVTDPAVVDDALDANATMLRFPAHVAPESVYDACDEAGLLVWQGLPERSPPDVDRAVTTGSRLVERLGYHPSLAALSVQETETDPPERPLGSGLLSKLRFRYRAWRTAVDRSAADSVVESLPTDVPVLPTIGPPGTGCEATTIWPGWAYLDPEDVDWLMETYPPSATAIAGFGAGTGGASGSTGESILTRRGLEGSAIDAHQVTVLKTVAESLRYRGCGTIVADTLVDSDERGGMGVLGSDRSRKPAFDAIAASFEPLQAITVGRPVAGGTTQLALVNDTTSDQLATVSWRVGSDEATTEVAVDAASTTDVELISLPAEADQLSVTVEAGDICAENAYSL